MDNRSVSTGTAALAVLVMLSLAGNAPAIAQNAAAPKSTADESVPTFDAAYMSDAANIKVGQGVWAKQCRHCHGSSAYPGKAPKLSPGGLAPDFIFDRVTNGFRAMPPWGAVFTLEERKAVTAYIKSDSFSP
jgi:mono/diheme cytochrome c family protein